MLPSFRLIAATFLCGFVLVFAGLRLAASVHSMHAAFPVMAAHAAPAPTTGASDWPSIPAAAPMLYDLRFVASATAPITVSLKPQHIDRSAPVAVPAAIETTAREPAPPPAATEVEPVDIPDAVIAIPSKAASPVEPAEPLSPSLAPAAPKTAAQPEAPPPQPVTVAAIAPPSAPKTEPAAADPAAAQPAATSATEALEMQKPDAATVEPAETPKADAATNEPPTPPAIDTAAIAPSPTPAATVALAPTATAAADPGAIEPPPAALVMAAVEPLTAADGIAIPDASPNVPVMVKVALPKPRPAGAVLQTAIKKRAGATRRTAARDPFRYNAFRNNPFGGGFDNWRQQRR